jgi:uncharacterized protein YyaL (SSP411 family)
MRCVSPLLQKPCQLLFCLYLLGTVIFSWGGIIQAQEPNGKSESMHKYTNALIDSNSPYLLQHAHNPVNWLPWGPEAFAKAKAENKPIFVSIGYSTCYWCHVMERESFENEAIAKIINEHYVAIKVDREQRPDIDEQLMLATQLLTGRGGWPNSVWLTSDGRPWMAGTYFPPQQFSSGLEQLARIWRDEASAVEKQAESLSQAIREATQIPSAANIGASVKSPDGGMAQPTAKPLDNALAELSQLFDEQHGGFGTKPKFPPHGSLRLLAQAVRTNNQPAAKQMLKRTLDAMWRGGIHDHVGGGFHRYSTDERWFLPHFEKMLYDNAQLLRSFAEGFELTGDETYRLACHDIVAWVKREMTHPDGGFYSALDSESDGHEGRYNTWSMAELKSVLSEREAELFARVYNFQEAGNFVEEATKHRPGTNIPFLSDPPQSVDAQTAESLQSIRDKLLKARGDRSYPHLDDKVLTCWNGLMIAALAHAGRVLDEPAFVDQATRAADFLLKELQTEAGLLHSWRNGSASIPAYLDDYAFLCEGLLELHHATRQPRWLAESQRLARQMQELFEDRTEGGFFFTSSQHEALIVRSKNLQGGGNLPVGNGIAIQVLLELNRQTGEEAYLQSVRRALRAFSGIALKAPRQVEHIVLAGAQYDALTAEHASNVTPRNLSKADDQEQSEALRAELFVSHAQRAPGEAFSVAVRVQIEPGFHLYGPPPAGSEMLVQATTLKLLPVEGLQAGAQKLPKGNAQEDPLLGGKVTVYEDSIGFTFEVDIDANASLGARELIIELSYQACDEKLCLPPGKIVLSTPLLVSSEKQSSEKHPEVFSHSREK